MTGFRYVLQDTLHLILTRPYSLDQQRINLRRDLFTMTLYFFVRNVKNTKKDITLHNRRFQISRFAIRT
jgi:hypothetical protein